MPNRSLPNILFDAPWKRYARLGMCEQAQRRDEREARLSRCDQGNQTQTSRRVKGQHHLWIIGPFFQIFPLR